MTNSTTCYLNNLHITMGKIKKIIVICARKLIIKKILTYSYVRECTISRKIIK